jgi:RHH-type proline utilization regulon transcriptional repressor/proline dehydrogenase/delta 1-pyrroline-5-carboxylate dehydrogenase
LPARRDHAGVSERQAMLDDVGAIDRSAARRRIRSAHLMPEPAAVEGNIARALLDEPVRRRIQARARALVEHIRGAERPRGLMEAFLAEYGLSNDEGVALMCLAEAMLRVPDTYTLDALIQDKIGPADWRRHLGHSESSFVNASSWGLMLAGRIVRVDDEALAGHVRALVRKLGEPVVRVAVAKSIGVLAEEFVLGRDIEEALARSRPLLAQGYRFSYDMLGEAALTEADARRYFMAYSRAIAAIAATAQSAEAAANPGISVKLSALHPRYEYAQRGRVMAELLPRVTALALTARAADLGFNIDAEEADRLELSLDVVDALSANPELKRWAGLGVVVQAYQKRAPAVLDWLAGIARRDGRRFMLRLVKGAYWDSEIKWHQERGLADYPVFTRKAATDISYLACARTILTNTELFYPQFATHNALSVAAVLELAGGYRDFEFQRLQGMGEVLHERLVRYEGVPSRIYAPVGVHKDLLAYLVRRLLENGANSSFVNQLVNDAVPVAELIADPIDELRAQASLRHPRIPLPPDLYGPERRNSEGLDLADPETLLGLEDALIPFRTAQWTAAPVVAGSRRHGAVVEVRNPARPDDVVGHAVWASDADIEAALDAARDAFADPAGWPLAARASALRTAADAYERARPELLTLCAREAGKSLADAVAEVREAVDFLRYYAAQAEAEARRPLGVFACISPWNFPLAIFTGQVAAALAAGNAVLAKPAEETPLIAARAVALLHAAGVPTGFLQLLPGPGESVGACLTADPRLAGVAFTGSTEVARTIRRAMAEAGNPAARLVAETGGINAMIVDSTALPEQAVKDILASAFQSAGQRCSALRLLFVQEDVADELLEMLSGAMAELRIGDPMRLSTDVGPLIDAGARTRVAGHVAALRRRARPIHECALPPEAAAGHFLAPAAFELADARELTAEVFGPVLHVVRFRASDLDRVVEALNAKGYGLTMGLHSRIDQTVERVSAQARVGNLYVNRNQIGAVVGAQPFGGEGLSGTGPKAGGPHYLLAFTGILAAPSPDAPAAAPTAEAPLAALAAAARALQGAWDRRHDRGAVLTEASRRLARQGHDGETVAAVAAAAEWADRHAGGPLVLAGPTGERNQMTLHGRGVFLCLGNGGPGASAVIRQAAWALAAGNGVIARLPAAEAEAFVAAGVPGRLLQCLPGGPWPALFPAAALASIEGVALAAEGGLLAAYARALAAGEGPIAPLISGPEMAYAFAIERVQSINTTAAGGNASLLAAAG